MFVLRRIDRAHARSFNSYYGVQVGTLWDQTTFGLAWRFIAFVWAAAVASFFYIVIAYRFRAIKELMIWGVRRARRGRSS